MWIFHISEVIHNEILFHSFSAEGLLVGILLAVGLKRRSFAGFLAMLAIVAACSIYVLNQPYLLISNDMHTNHIIVGKYNFIIGAIVGCIMGILSFHVSKQSGILRKLLTIIVILVMPVALFAIEEVVINHTLFQ